MELDELMELHRLLGKYCNFMGDALKGAKESANPYVRKYVASDYSKSIKYARNAQFEVGHVISIVEISKAMETERACSAGNTMKKNEKKER